MATVEPLGTTNHNEAGSSRQGMSAGHIRAGSAVERDPAVLTGKNERFRSSGVSNKER